MIARPDGKRIHVRINPDAFKVDGKIQQKKYNDRLKEFANLFHNFELPPGVLGIMYMNIRKRLWNCVHVL